MKLLKQYGLAIFWAFLFLDCILINFRSSQPYRILTKPTLLLILATYFYINTKRTKHVNSKFLVYGGLFFTWLGDWMLLKNDFTPKYQGDIYLVTGIILLLLGFGMYTLLFKKMTTFNIKDCQEAFLATIAMVIVMAIFYNILKSTEIGNFKILIFAGMIIMTVMMAYAANVYHDKIRRNIANSFLIPGVIVLIISMGVIVAHRFLLQDAEFLPAVIMLTYGFGQMLVVRGFTKYLKA